MFLSVVDGTVAGLIGIADPIKESTPEAIRLLHEDGVRIVMLTGDNRRLPKRWRRNSALTKSRPKYCPSKKAEDRKTIPGGRAHRRHGG